MRRRDGLRDQQRDHCNRRKLAHLLGVAEIHGPMIQRPKLSHSGAKIKRSLLIAQFAFCCRIELQTHLRCRPKWERKSALELARKLAPRGCRFPRGVASLAKVTSKSASNWNSSLIIRSATLTVSPPLASLHFVLPFCQNIGNSPHTGHGLPADAKSNLIDFNGHMRQRREASEELSVEIRRARMGGRDGNNGPQMTRSEPPQVEVY